MKKLFFFLIVVASPVSFFAADNVMYSEDFESSAVFTTQLTPQTEVLLGNQPTEGDGKVYARSYNSEGVMTVGVDTVSPISGTKSAYFNLENTGVRTGAIRYRIERTVPITVGSHYRTTFKIASSVANTILFRVEGMMPSFADTVNLTGGYSVQEFTIMSPVANQEGFKGNFQFDFSTPAVPGEIWLDDIVIEEVKDPFAAIETHYENMKIWSEKNTVIVNSTNNGVAEVYSLTGQKMAASPVNIFGKTTINIPENELCVIVKLFNANHGFKAYKLIMN